MSDIERAAFEEWVVGRLENVFPTTFLRRPTGEYFSAFIELRWEGWKFRASRPVVVTDERVEAAARKLAGQDMREDGFSEQAALDAEKGDMWRNFKNSARVAIAALNGGTDETV